MKHNSLDQLIRQVPLLCFRIRGTENLLDSRVTKGDHGYNGLPKR